MSPAVVVGRLRRAADAIVSLLFPFPRSEVASMAFYNTISDASNFVISFTPNPRQDFSVFAKGYAQAASVLATYLLEERSRFADYEAYPVVFLYRHAFELYLKGFCYGATFTLTLQGEALDLSRKILYKHRLLPLANAFQQICEVLCPSDEGLLKIAEKAIQFAVEFEQIDKDSYSYRYPINTRGMPSTKQHQLVNLRALHNSMQEFLAELEVVDFGLSIEDYHAQKIFEILQETIGNILSGENGDTG